MMPMGAAVKAPMTGSLVRQFTGKLKPLDQEPEIVSVDCNVSVDFSVAEIVR